MKPPYELEMVYCKKCRDHFEADHTDIATYYCPKCRRLDVVETKKMFEQFEKRITELYSKGVTK